MKGVIVLLRGITLGLGLHQLGACIQDLLLGSTALNRMLVSFCGFYLRQSTCSLSPSVGILELHEQVALADVLSFTNMV